MKKFLEEWSFVIWFALATIGMGWIAFHPYPPIYAAPAAKSDAPGECSHFATNGPIEVLKCIDPQTDGILYIDNVGMMTKGD